MLNQAVQRIKFLYRTLTRRNLDLFDQLESDHIRIEMLLLRWEFSSSAIRREEIFETIRSALGRHFESEEKIFYSAAKKITGLKRLMAESEEDHDHIRELLREISQLSPESNRIESKMKSLVQAIEQHVHLEENEIFPLARGAIKKVALNYLGRELRQMREKRTSDKMAA